MEKAKKIFGILFFFLFLLDTSLVVVYMNMLVWRNPENGEALLKINNQLISLALEYPTLTGKKKEKAKITLKNLLIERKKLLFTVLETEPELISLITFSTDKLSLFPKESALNILLEKEITLRGRVMVTELDNFRKELNSRIYRLQTLNIGSSGIYRLYGINSFSELIPDTQIVTRGKLLDFKLIVTETKQTGGRTYRQIFSENQGDFSTLVILFNFVNNKARPFSVGEVEEAIFSGSSSANQYYQSLSGGKVSFYGNAVGWFTIQSENKDCQENYESWSGQADTQAVLAGVDLKGYKRKIYVFPQTNECGFEGMAEVFGQRVWMNGINAPAGYVHELGHTFGLGHAGYLFCRGAAVDVYNSCTISTYGDKFDPMGWLPGKTLYQTNISNRFFLNFQKSCPLVTNEEVRRLYNFSGPNKDNCLKIWKKDTNEFYYLEYRKAEGLDANLPKEITEGALIHIRKENDYDTLLVNVNPLSYVLSLKETALSDQEYFVDPVNRIFIKQLAHNNDFVLLEIKP